MKHLKLFQNFSKLNESEEWIDANRLTIDIVKSINELYGELLPQIEYILEEKDIFSDSIYFFNGYFSHEYKIKEIDFFNEILEKESQKESPNLETCMIKGIMVEDVNRDKILSLSQTSFDRIIDIIKNEDFDNVLSDEVLQIVQDKLKDQDVKLHFELYYGYQPIKLNDIWRKGSNYNLRFKLEVNPKIFKIKLPDLTWKDASEEEIKSKELKSLDKYKFNG